MIVQGRLRILRSSRFHKVTSMKIKARPVKIQGTNSLIQGVYRSCSQHYWLTRRTWIVYNDFSSGINRIST